jgi:UDP-N-acetylglucosamine--N-acetylmuramyl-(pentapeptide) pyrophosphoryl-undecaprenol N-acetylglucosamine transferase
MRVYIGCFGSGLGHASRMLEVAGALVAKGADVEFSSSGEVATLISSKGYRCNRLPLADVRYSESGAFQVKETLLDSPAIFARTYRQLGREVANLRKFGPDVVLSDSALPTVMAGRLLRIPVFTVLNQLNLTSSHAGSGAPSRLLSAGTSAGMGRLWEFSDEILLPDLPPPYTISEKNLWGSNIAKTRYVGFLIPTGESPPDGAATEFTRDRRPKVFWQVSGPPRTRKPLLKMALEFASSLGKKYAFVVSGGDPGGDRTARKKGGVWYYDWCDISDFYFRNCDVVVSRAGHGTIGQAITSMKPSLLIPIPKQPEQEGNAEKAVKLGVALALGQGELTAESLDGSLASLLSGGYGREAVKLGELAHRYDARSSIVSILEASASRARPGLR